MSSSTKVRWQWPVLLLKVLACLFVWGLPALLALFGIEMPDDPVFLRTFGAVVTAVSLLYWYAYKDPLGNMAILRSESHYIPHSPPTITGSAYLP